MIKFKVDINSFKTGTDYEAEGEVRCYTDGSKINGQTGFGICIKYNWNAPETRSRRINDINTVFQAEVQGYILACELIRNHLEANQGSHIEKVTILSDSQAALQAIKSTHIDSLLVQDAITELNNLGQFIKIELVWIKAHVNHPGNELADAKAKEGAHSDDIPVMNRAAKSEVRNAISNHYVKLWTKWWSKYKKCRQTKIWFPEPDINKSKKSIKYNRATFSTMVRWVTGHNFLKRHNAIVEPEPHDPNCRYCGLEPETSSHIITECEVLCHHRSEIFNTHFLNPREPVWRVDRLIAFLQLDCARTWKVRTLIMILL